MTSEDRLADVRQRIDAIDGEILRLLSARAACAHEVALIKLEVGDSQFYRPGREAEVLRRIKARNPGPLSGEAMARLFREIMSACLALEQPLAVAFLGPAGTFTQAAAVKHFGHAANTVPVGSIGDVFREVEARSCHYGVVPVENSTEGVINHTLDMFMRSPLNIAGEVSLRDPSSPDEPGARPGGDPNAVFPPAIPGPMPGLAGSPPAPGRSVLPWTATPRPPD